MNRLIRVFTFICGVSLVSGSAFGSETLARSITTKLTVQPSGNATLEIEEKMPQSALSKLYVEHNDAVNSDGHARDNYLEELAKGHYLRYRNRPELGIIEEGNGGDGFARKLKGEVAGAVQKSETESGAYELAVKRYDNEKQAGDLLAYYESVLDGTTFETMFLASQKGDQELRSEETTVYALPKGSQILNLKDLEGKAWKVDFGGGNMMTASLDVDEKNAEVTLHEVITVTEETPKNLMNEKNEAVFDQLRQYAGFTIVHKPPKGVYAALVPSQGMDTALDYSNSWNFGVSQTLSHAFTYSTLTVTPSATLGFNLGVSVYWEHYWRKINWYTYRWSLRKFEATVSVNPSLGLNVDVTSSGTVSKEWEQNIITKTTTTTFFVSFVPVMIVLEAKLDVGASANISGTIGFNTGVTLNLNTSLTTKYENGWSLSSSKSFTPTFNGFNANARVSATVRGEAPFTVSGYLYYVAGPFAQLVPYIQGDVWAQAGQSTQVGYKIVGGAEVNGGVQMAGWLKDLLGGIGTYSNTFYNYETPISQGTKNIQ